MTDTTAAQALGTTLLPSIAESIAVPQYDRSSLRASIVHIGVGGFHRAHLATYVDELCTAGRTDWGIVGCGVLPGDAAMAAALHAQETLYTLITRGAEHTSVRVIGSMVNYIHGSPDPQAIIDQIAAVDTQIVSLTVTEGGYPIDDDTGDYLSIHQTLVPRLRSASLPLALRSGESPMARPSRS